MRIKKLQEKRAFWAEWVAKYAAYGLRSDSEPFAMAKEELAKTDLEILEEISRK